MLKWSGELRVESWQGQAESPKAPDHIRRSCDGVGDPLAITYPDPDHSALEQRFLTVGMSSVRRVLIVAHADRSENIRIISARKTTPHEQKDYEEKN